MKPFKLDNGITNLNVCCVYWGDKFSTDYVQTLYYMVRRHLTIPHNFIVFTDNVKLPKMIHNKDRNISFQNTIYKVGGISCRCSTHILNQ